MRGRFGTWLTMILAVLSQPVLAAEPWDALRQGGVVILMRHAATDPGTGDPPGFRVDDCKTQRNLSAQGELKSKLVYAWISGRS